MNIPCPNRTICPGSDDPVGNYTYTDPDLIVFRNLSYPVFDPSDPLGGGPGSGGPPQLFFAFGCLTLCESTVSQAAADQCAQTQALQCTYGDPTHATFNNSLAQCSAGCPDGSTFTWTILPGVFFAPTQVLADTLAQTLACQKAAAFFFCLSAISGTFNLNQTSTGVISITGANPGPFSAQVVSGSLPPGTLLSQGPSSIIIAGKPTQAGDFTFILAVTDNGGNTVEKSYTITVKGNCPAFWASLNGLWIPNTGGPSSVATVIGNVVTLSADAPLPGPSTGTAQLTAQAAVATTDQLTCTLTVQSITVFNPPPPINTQFSILIQDAFLPNVYLNVSFSSATMPAPGTVFSFTMPAGATPQISLICFTINALNGLDSIIGATLVLG